MAAAPYFLLYGLSPCDWNLDIRSASRKFCFSMYRLLYALSVNPNRVGSFPESSIASCNLFCGFPSCSCVFTSNVINRSSFDSLPSSINRIPTISQPFVDSLGISLWLYRVRGTQKDSLNSIKSATRISPKSPARMLGPGALRSSGKMSCRRYSLREKPVPSRSLSISSSSQYWFLKCFAQPLKMASSFP